MERYIKRTCPLPNVYSPSLVYPIHLQPSNLTETVPKRLLFFPPSSTYQHFIQTVAEVFLSSTPADPRHLEVCDRVKDAHFQNGQKRHDVFDNASWKNAIKCAKEREHRYKFAFANTIDWEPLKIRFKITPENNETRSNAEIKFQPVSCEESPPYSKQEVSEPILSSNESSDNVSCFLHKLYEALKETKPSMPQKRALGAVPIAPPPNRLLLAECRKSTKVPAQETSKDLLQQVPKPSSGSDQIIISGSSDRHVPSTSSKRPLPLPLIDPSGMNFHDPRKRIYVTPEGASAFGGTGFLGSFGVPTKRRISENHQSSEPHSDNPKRIAGALTTPNPSVPAVAADVKSAIFLLQLSIRYPPGKYWKHYDPRRQDSYPSYPSPIKVRFRRYLIQDPPKIEFIFVLWLPPASPWRNPEHDPANEVHVGFLAAASNVRFWENRQSRQVGIQFWSDFTAGGERGGNWGFNMAGLGRRENLEKIFSVLEDAAGLSLDAKNASDNGCLVRFTVACKEEDLGFWLLNWGAKRAPYDFGESQTG
ncbi:hypothetical protein RUND412_010005, partial [Rhizina undulata]